MEVGTQGPHGPHERLSSSDLKHVGDTHVPRERANLVLPVGIGSVVHRAERAELSSALELGVTRAGNDRSCPGGHGKLQAEDLYAARSLEQHEVTGPQLPAGE